MEVPFNELQVRTRDQLLEDFYGPQPEQLKLANLIWSLGSALGGGLRAARVYRTTSQVGADYTVLTAIPWDGEDLDTDDFFDAGSPTIFTIPELGLYTIEAFVSISSFTAGEWAQAIVLVNGSPSTAPGFAYSNVVASAAGATLFPSAKHVFLSEGDTISIGLLVETDASVNIALLSYMMIQSVG